MSSGGPPTRGPGQTEPDSWPSSRSQSRACGSGTAHCTSTSAAGTRQPHHGNCDRSENGGRGGSEVVGGYFGMEISAHSGNKIR